eukprot:8393071-Prorocentrum_lima.AAC.1
MKVMGAGDRRVSRIKRSDTGSASATNRANSDRMTMATPEEKTAAGGCAVSGDPQKNQIKP